jgi:potassium efflux system protein
VLAAAVMWLSIVGVQAACGQLPEQPDTPAPVADVPATPALTVEALQARRESMEKNTSLPEADKTMALEALAGAVKALQEEQLHIERLRTLQASSENVAAQLEPMRTELESPTQDPEKPSPDVDLSTAQQRLAEFEVQLRAAEASKAQLDEQDAQRTKRRTEAPAELSRARAELDELGAEPTMPVEGQQADVQSAVDSLRQAKRRELMARIALLERELPIYDATSAILSAKRSLAARKVSVARRAVETWQEFVNKQRLSEAESYLKEAAAIVDKSSPAAADTAKELLTLAEELLTVRSKLATDIASVSKLNGQTEAQVSRLKTDFEEITDRAEAAGFTNSVGVLLRKHRYSLPDQHLLDQEIADRQVQIANTHIERLDYQNQKAIVIDVEELAEREASRPGNGLTERGQQELRNELRIIYQARARYLDGVIGDLSSYLDRLATLDVTQRELLNQTESQADYIAEHILWVRSTTALDSSTLPQCVAALSQLKTDLAEIGSALRRDVQLQSQLWLVAVVALLMALAVRGRLRDRLVAAGQIAARKTTTEMRPTLVTLGVTIVTSAIWPSVCLFIGWRLISGRSTEELITASGYAFRATALLMFSLDVLRHVCRGNGLGVAHFQWPARSVNTVRQTVRMILFVAVPITGFSLMMWGSQNEVYESSLGRLTLIVALIILAAAMHRALRPGSAVIEESISLAPDGWISHTRYFWYAMGVGIPIVLSCLAAAGYMYTARQLSLRLAETGGLLLVIVLTACLLNRWQLLTYRNLAMKQARERRAMLAREQEKSGGDDEIVATLKSEELLETLSDTNVRLGKLFSAVFAIAVLAGLGVIWNDVLPAFGVLSKVRLWQSSEALEVVNGVTEYEWITLREILLAGLTLVLTFFAATNIPALLEFAVLPRLPFDSGTRYAISTVLRYLITVPGVALAVSVLGFGWANIQWLVAAMTVGLGFGLQEIFANFVSGLILLFERPIRIGDTVTVGDVTGTVTRIRIRATTIVDWDRKELVVPNREFVTGQLVNWTLSDAVLRVVVRVGIAYGSDTRLATKLLYQVAADNDDVLEDPPPKVIFSAFGSSSLDFELRCFVSSPQQWRVISHELNLAIDDLFRQNNIEIAFPQQDLHVRSIDIKARDIIPGAL